MIWVLLAACKAPDTVTVVTTAELAGPIGDLVRYADDRLSTEVADDPTKGGSRGRRVAVVLDEDCAGCWRLDVERRDILVHAGDLLGAQYGVADALERLGWRFLHPFDTARPAKILEPDPDGSLREPEIPERGLDPHTLHPIEAEMVLWEADGDPELAKRIVDWTVKLRGNHLELPGLDDVAQSPATREAWLTHMTEIADYAHSRGLTLGVGVQLFGSSNLQQAFDLVDSPTDPETDRAAVRERLAILTPVGFDRYALSFGEFFGEDPATFVAYLDMAVEEIVAAAPAATLTASVHVGNPEELTVEYAGEEILYYYLVKHADPRLVPSVHTVMYYTLYDPVGGTYGVEDFSDHRDFLLERVAAGEPVAYFPETAYWVAFDVNVPTSLPVYVHSRWRDLDGLRADGALSGLSAHTLFSSGWEWGYWQNDYLAVRMGFDVPADFRAPLVELWAPWGADGDAVSGALGDLAEIQSEALIHGGLAPYLAGREATLDLGETALGIVAQPPRPYLADIAGWTPEARAAYAADTLGRLDALAADTDAVLGRIPTSDDRWIAEARDGVEITALRTRFVAAVFRGAVEMGDGGDGAARIAEADALLADARVVVGRRHAALHAPAELASRLISPVDTNPTIYPFGYLARADELCFWTRELAQLRQVAGSDESPPGCAF